jgi:hypothetical protein
MNKHIIALTTALLSSFLAITASADIYLGAGIYYSSIDEDGLDESDATPAIYLGWKPIDLIAIELGYYDLGSYENDIQEFEADAITLAAMLTLPTGPINTYAKLGFADASSETSTVLGKAKNDGTENFVAIGSNLNITSLVDIYIELQNFAIDESDLFMLGAGARLNF